MSICSSSVHRVTFHHPAYDSTRLFEVPTFDSPNGGIHYGTALLLCGVIAGNVWDGWLTETRESEKLDLDVESLLMGRDYYFYIPRPSLGDSVQEDVRLPYKYPVVASLQHWRFPHDNPPPGWTFTADFSDTTPFLFPMPSISSVSQAIKDRDISCRLSSYQDGIERAHLCPRSELEWFNMQEMERYNTNQSLKGVNLVDDMANSLALRSDIHAAFDAGTFMFTRKKNSWVSHFLTPTYNLGPEHHNMSIEMPAAVHPVFLLTRLAWVILPKTGTFLARGEKRTVKLRTLSGAESVQELTGEDLRGLIGISMRGRSNSPRKRLREEDATKDVAGPAGETLKRPRPTFDSSTTIPMATTDLYDAETTCSISQSRPSEYISIDLANGPNEQAHIEKLRQQALSTQRRIHSSLMCCDYDASEKADELGIEGPKEFGGAHLCWQCLGAELENEL